MDQTEYEALVRAQEAYAARLDTATRFTAALLGEMHREWLGELYEWAGKYRTLELSKGNFTWPPAQLVSHNMMRFEAGLLREHTPCAPAELPEVARRIAEVHAELLFIHPFREGNGRLARWLADFMALQAGRVIQEYGLEGRGWRNKRASYLEEVTKGYVRDYGALTDFFREVLE